MWQTTIPIVTRISNLFFGFEAALLASDDLGLAFGGLIGDRRSGAETSVGVERLDVTAQSTLGAWRVVAERTAVIEVQSHVSVELQLTITYHTNVRILSHLRQILQTRKLSYRKHDRAMRHIYIYGYPENFRVPEHAHGYFSCNF